MSPATQTVTLTVTVAQEVAIISALRTWIGECERHIAALAKSRNEKTDLATFWQGQLADAQQALDIFRRAL